MHSFKILMNSKTYMLITSSLKGLVKNHLKYTFIYLFILSYDLLYLNLEKNARDGSVMTEPSLNRCWVLLWRMEVRKEGRSDEYILKYKLETTILISLYLELYTELELTF